MGVCIRWRYWASYSFDVQSAHRKSHFSEHSRSEAPKTASWLTASSVFAENRFVSAFFFFRHRLPRFLSFSFSHMDAHFCLHWHLLFMAIPLPIQLHFFKRPWMWYKSGSGYYVHRVFFNRFVSWFAGKVTVAPVWSCQVSSKPTCTTQIKELQRHFMFSRGDLILMPRNFPPFC